MATKSNIAISPKAHYPPTTFQTICLSLLTQKIIKLFFAISNLLEIHELSNFLVIQTDYY